MNQTAPHLAYKKDLQGAVPNGRLLQARQGRGGKKQTCLALEDEKGAARQIPSSVLTRKFQTGIQMAFLADIKTAIRLVLSFDLVTRAWHK